MRSILYLRPESALTADDFAKLASAVDPHIEGIGPMAAHFRFVRDHTRT